MRTRLRKRNKKKGGGGCPDIGYTSKQFWTQLAVFNVNKRHFSNNLHIHQPRLDHEVHNYISNPPKWILIFKRATCLGTACMQLDVFERKILVLYKAKEVQNDQILHKIRNWKILVNMSWCIGTNICTVAVHSFTNGFWKENK